MELNTSEAQFINKLLEEKNLKEYFECQTRGISDESFVEETPQKAWKFIQEYVKQYNRIPTLQSVKDQVPLFAPGNTPDQFAYYRDKLIKQMHRIKIANFATDLAKKVQNDENEIIEFIGKTYQSLIKGERISDFGRFREMLDRIDEYKRKLAAGEQPIGIPTGITPLDEHFLGFRPGDYGIISGRPGEGKTTLALFMAYSAFMEGHKVSYITLEMPREQIFEKLDALSTRISINKIKRMKLTEKELAQYRERAEQIKTHESDIYVHDRTGSCTIVTVEAILNQDEPDILFVDSIYLMRGTSKKTQWENIKELSNMIKQLAMKYRKPIVVLSQVNRDGTDTIKNGELPSVAHLSYSDALGQDADHVFVLTSNEKTRFYKAKRLSAIKLRGAAEKDMIVKWDPTTNYFEYIDEYNNVRSASKDVQNVVDMQQAYKPKEFSDNTK